MWNSFKNAIKNAIKVLQEEAPLPLTRANVLIAPDQTFARPETIESTAAITIKRWFQTSIARRQAKIALSPSYAKRKAKIGLPAVQWNLILTGTLAKSMQFFVKDGALYVKYDNSRDEIVQYLKQRSGYDDLLHPTEEEAEFLAGNRNRLIRKNFLLAWRRRK